MITLAAGEALECLTMQGVPVIIPDMEYFGVTQNYAKLGGRHRAVGAQAARANTTTSHGRLMLIVLGGLAVFERDLTRARTAEGRQPAKAHGVRLGRRPKLTPHQQREAIKRQDSGEPIRDIARSYNVHNSTISRLAS